MPEYKINIIPLPNQGKWSVMVWVWDSWDSGSQILLETVNSFTEALDLGKWAVANDAQIEYNYTYSEDSEEWEQ